MVVFASHPKVYHLMQTASAEAVESDLYLLPSQEHIHANTNELLDRLFSL